MKLNKRKGFTIVELVIVIAVIAILAAVLIPNISNLVKKANASADESLVRNLNTALSMDVEKHLTMSDALDKVLLNGGYELTTIVTKNKDNKILWDSKNDCFVYLNGSTIKYLPNTQEDKTVTDVDYFEIVELKDGKVPESKYSAYLAGESVLGTVEVERGLDVGKNTVAEVVFKTTEKVSVLINTNGGKLTVNAGEANVTHRGDASIVTIEAVAKKSYHENGKVNEIKLKAGRVVVEAKAEVGSVLVTATTEGAVEVEVKDTASLGAVGATDSEIAKKLNTVVKNPGKTEILENPITDSGFAGGFGTEKAPYLVETKVQLEKINDVFTTEKKVWFKQIADIEIDKSWNPVKLHGAYDGSNYSVTMNGGEGAASVVALFASIADTTVTDLKIVSDESCLLAAVEYASEVKTVYGEGNQSIYLNGITATVKDGKTVSVYESNAGFLVYSHIWNEVNQPVEITLTNCSVIANAKSSSTCLGAFIGGTVYFQYPYGNKLTIDSCSFKGNLYGQQVGLIFGNGTAKENKSILGEDYALTQEQLQALTGGKKADGSWKNQNLFFNDLTPKDSSNKTFSSVFESGNSELKILAEKYTSAIKGDLTPDGLTAYLSEIGLLDKIKIRNVDASEALFNGTTGVGVFSNRAGWDDRTKVETMAIALLETHYRVAVKGNYSTRNELKNQSKVAVSVDSNGNFYLDTNSFQYNSQYTYKIMVSIGGVLINDSSDFTSASRSLNGRSILANLSLEGFDGSKKWKSGSSYAYNEAQAKASNIDAVKSITTTESDPAFENSFRYKVVVDNNNYYIVLSDTSITGNLYSQPWINNDGKNVPNDYTKAKISLTLVAYENDVMVGSVGIN